MTRFVLAGAIALALLTAVYSSADGATLCRKRRGQLVVREACRKRERPVDAATLGVAGPAGPPGAAGDPAEFPVRLVDTNDVEVGKIIDFNPGSALVEVQIPSVPTPLIMFIGARGFPSDTFVLFYESQDCSGVAYMRDYYGEMQFPPYAPVWGLAAYYRTAGRRQITYASTEYAPDAECGPGTTPTGRKTCCAPGSDTATGLVPTARIPLSAFGLVPPFRAVPR